MVRFAPVEAGAGGDEDLFLLQEIQGHLLVAADVEALHVHLREDVEGRPGLYHADARDVAQRPVDHLPLLIEPAAGAKILVHRLIAAQGGLDDALGRDIGAQAHLGQQVDAVDVALGPGFVPCQAYPAAAEARHPVGFGQAVEAQRQQIRGQRGQGHVLLLPFHHQPVIDLVGKEDQVVLPGHLDDLLQQFPGIQRAGGVVGVDDHDALGLVGDLGADIRHVGIPVRLLVADVMHRLAAGEGDGRRPQGVIRGGDQDLVPVVQKPLHGEGDELADAVAGENVVHAHVGDLLDLTVLHDGLPGGEQTPGV